MPPLARSVQIPMDGVSVDADLHVPAQAAGLVIFAHGSGSSRFSHRNRAVAAALQDAGFATLLIDLLTAPEEAQDQRTGQHRFDVARLAQRVVGAIAWARRQEELRQLAIACFGASTGAAAALLAAAARPADIRAVISRGGRPDLAREALRDVQAPTLLVVGGADAVVLEMNRAAMRQMRAPVRLQIVPGASHLFEEPGALDQVAALAAEWCREYLPDGGA